MCRAPCPGQRSRKTSVRDAPHIVHAGAKVCFAHAAREHARSADMAAVDSIHPLAPLCAPPYAEAV